MTDQISPSNNTGPRGGSWHQNSAAHHVGGSPVLFWLTVLGLGCFTFAGMTLLCMRLFIQNDPQKPLRVEQFVPKLKGSSEERKEVLAESKEGKGPHVSPVPSINTRGAGLDPIEPPKALRMAAFDSEIVLNACSDPVIYANPCTSHRGDSPMISNWKTLTMYSLLSAAAVTVAPPEIFSQEKDEKKAPQVDIGKILNDLSAAVIKLETVTLPGIGTKVDGVGADVQGLKKTIGDLTKDVGAIQQNQLKQTIELESQKREIDKLTKEVRELHARVNTDPKSSTPGIDKAAIDELTRTMKAIHESLARLGPTETVKRDSMALPNANSASLGRIKLVNHFSDDVVFVINGTIYRVAPNTMKVLNDFPVGLVNYRVMTDRHNTLEMSSATLSAGKTFTLTAR